MSIKNFLQICLLILMAFSVIGCGVSNDHSPGTSSSQVKISKSISYDGAGRVVREDLGNGKYIKYVYDKNGNIVEINKN